MSLLHGNSGRSVDVLTSAQRERGQGMTHALGVSPPPAEPHPCWKILGVVNHLYVFPSGPRHAISRDVIEAGRLHVPVFACEIAILSAFATQKPKSTTNTSQSSADWPNTDPDIGRETILKLILEKDRRFE
jgi:hypothetical protein